MLRAVKLGKSVGPADPDCHTSGNGPAATFTALAEAP